MQIENSQPNFVLGLILLTAGISLRLFGSCYYYVWLEPISIVPSVAGLVLLIGGSGAWKWAWPSVLFLSFMVPLPYRVDTALAGPLQRLATVVSTFLMQVIGLPALAEGNTILVNDHTLGIVEACSGLRMLVVFFALSTAVVMVIQRPWLDKLIVLMSSIPIALFCNVIRILVTGILFEATSSEWAHAFFHDAAGWMMMLLALALLAGELQLLSAIFVPIPGGEIQVGRRIPRPAGANAPRRRARRVRSSARPLDRRKSRSKRRSRTKQQVLAMPSEDANK